LFTISPYIEVVARRIYWSSPWLIEKVRKKRDPKRTTKRRNQAASTKQTFHKIESFMRSHGVSKGTLLVVHSSASALTPTGYSPSNIIDRLLEFIGTEGTLAMPAFPWYDREPRGIERMRADVSDLELTYHVRKSVPWTGVIPFQLMNRTEARRSRHPLNTMVAVGPLAKDMMQDNLAGEKPLPCGPGSSWKFCVDHKAIIVALGVDMAHSLTMIHVAEDSYQREWPVKEWYRERKFKIVDESGSVNVVVRERHPKWAIHFAERTLSKDLKGAGILASTKIDGILVEIIGAEDLLEFLNSRKATAYPYFLLPRGNKK
jgi:aminoglycoside 3-N-acetyltransferase